MASILPASSSKNSILLIILACCARCACGSALADYIADSNTANAAAHPLLLDDDVVAPLRTAGLTSNDRNIYYKDISANDTLTLSCIGSRPIAWRYPKQFQQNENDKKRLKIMVEQDAAAVQQQPAVQQQRQARLTQSTLSVSNARYSDTGEYQCYFVTNDGDQQPETSSSSGRVFVFVNDYKNLFAAPLSPGGFSMIILNQAQEAVFPCIPTFSHANVTLRRLRHSGGYENVLLSRDSNGGGQFLYAPTRGGIVIPFPARSMQGDYECLAEVGGPDYGETQTGRLRVKVIKFIPAANFVPAPSIDTTGAKHVIEGGNMTLSCYVRQPHTAAFDRVDLQWFGPSAAAQRRMRIWPNTKMIPLPSGDGSASSSDIVEFRRSFTIADVDASTDNGQYKCVLTRGASITRETNITIRAYHSHQRSHISFPSHSQNNNLVVVNLTTPIILDDEDEPQKTLFVGTYLPQSAVFMVPLDIYPLPPTLIQWRKADRVLLPQQQQQQTTTTSSSLANISGGKYNISNTVDFSMSFLKVNDIRSVTDGGNFSLHIETVGPLRKSINFQLVVNAVPVVWPLQIDNQYKNNNETTTSIKRASNNNAEYFVALYNVNISPRVMCRASGSPRPVITWYMHECRAGTPAETCMDLALSLTTTTNNDEGSWRKVSQILYENKPTAYGVSSTVAIPRGGQPVWFRCDASNSLSTSDDSFSRQILLALPTSSDEQMGSLLSAQLIVSPAEPLADVDEDVIVKCRASNMLYKEVELTVRALAHSGSRNVEKIWLPEKAERFVVSDNVQLKGLAANATVLADCVFHPISSSQPIERRSLSFTVKLPEAPTIAHVSPATVDPHDGTHNNITVPYDESLHLSCNAAPTARPAPTYTWLKNDIPVQYNKASYRVENDGKTLVLTRVVEEDSGKYECVVKNRVDEARHAWLVDVVGDPQGATAFKRKNRMTMLLVIIGSAIIFALMLVCLIWFCIKWRKERKLRKQLQRIERLQKTKGALEQLNPDVSLSNQAELLEFKEQFEFPRDKIRLLDNVPPLGQGKFGQVVLGEACGIYGGASNKREWARVAVKMPRDAGDVTQLNMLLSESKVHMFVGNHVNVVSLLGTVTKNFQLGEMLLILEYCGNGSLRSFLQRHRRVLLENAREMGRRKRVDSGDSVFASEMTPMAKNDGASEEDKELMPLNVNHLLAFCCQIACGMAFLADRRVIHRDLATRNVLVNDALIVKISDFGLARQAPPATPTTAHGADPSDDAAQYSRSALKEYKEEPLPIKWLAPECVTGHFSTFSDVWSYGVVMWEIFSFGDEPYPADKPRDLMLRIVNGYRMQRPPLAPLPAYTIMSLCWDSSPKQRPTFNELQRLVLRLIDSDVQYQELYAQQPYDYMHLMTQPAHKNGENGRIGVQSSSSYSPSTALTYTTPAAAGGEDTTDSTGYSSVNFTQARGLAMANNSGYGDSGQFSSSPLDYNSAIEMTPLMTTKAAGIDGYDNSIMGDANFSPSSAASAKQLLLADDNESYLNEQFSPDKLTPLSVFITTNRIDRKT